ncbi:hypothetical protein BDB01DRAFT_505606 [Pilobolus umbonatus]|nr:hypothetical protein BDB01DRAFT_505606 [Pilobolus umbonatus]
MKDGFKSIQIEPTEGYLDFIGPAKSSHANESTRVLKGEVKFILIKPVKIKNMSVKFKGFSHITLREPNTGVSASLLPKLKLTLFGRTTLPAGQHIIPWEIDIPNIYPRSLLMKRASINYKVMVCISIGITKTITAEYPIVLRRHLMPYKELAPIIETKLFQKTIPGKFHYEIDTPQIICLEQDYIPLAIKYISFANHKSVQSIRTRLIQVELYRRQAPNKSETDLSSTSKDMLMFEMDSNEQQTDYKDTHSRFIKKTVPGIIHTPDNITSAWKKPCLIRHRLHPYVAYTLNSPLITIYHQIEVTFQFGMKYEEIKEKLPIIIASIPAKDTASSISNANDIMMCYAFEENARNEYLPHRYESRESGMMSVDDDPHNHNDDVQSILRDNGLLEDGARPINGRSTPMLLTHGYKAPALALPQPPFMKFNGDSTPSQGQSANDLLSPVQPKGLKKYASAFDLSSVSQETTPVSKEYEDIDERPRTTTPTMRRYPFRRPLPPINVDLANRPEQAMGLRPLAFNDRHHLASSSASTAEPSSSNILPAADHNMLMSQTNLQQRPLAHQNTSAPHQNGYRRNPPCPIDVSMNEYKNGNTMDDLQSIYSSASSGNAPSLSSSATLSTNKSHPTLQSRPASPVFSPAPGLPATIPLRRQDNRATQIEEMFDTSGPMSPAMNTVASSTLLSPRTARSLRNRIALSTISSLTNDSLYLGSSIISSLNCRASSTVDPDVNKHHIDDMETYFPPPDRYINAKLPPIPTLSNSTEHSNKSKRLTKVYLDDSDEEIIEDEPALPTMLPAAVTNLLQEDHAPPKLPRLSFGGDFGTSLGIDIL